MKFLLIIFLIQSFYLIDCEYWTFIFFFSFAAKLKGNKIRPFSVSVNN